MHPKGFAKQYFWPHRDDECWIPVEDLLLKLSTPSTSSTARHYTFDVDELRLISDMVL